MKKLAIATIAAIAMTGCSADGVMSATESSVEEQGVATDSIVVEIVTDTIVDYTCMNHGNRKGCTDLKHRVVEVADTTYIE